MGIFFINLEFNMCKKSFIVYFFIIFSITMFGQPLKSLIKSNYTANNSVAFINDSFAPTNNPNICNPETLNKSEYKPVEIIMPLANKIELQYDNNGTLLNQVYYEWLQDRWRGNSKICYYYGNSGLLDKAISFLGYGNEWRASDTTVYFYDSVERLTKILVSSYSFNVEIFYEYNYLNKIANYIQKRYNNHILSFEYDYHSEYDSLGQMLTQVVKSLDEQSGESNWKYTYSYNSSSKLTNSVMDWLSDSGWVNCEKTEYFYSDSLLLSTKSSTLLDTGWTVSELVDYSYNFANSIVKKTATIYYNGLGLGLDSTRILEEYNYDENNNCINAQGFNHQNNEWISYPTKLTCYYNNNLNIFEQVANKIEISYSTFTDVIDEANQPKEVLLEQNYPNPFNPTTTISYNLPNSGLTSLKVYDVLGKEVATLINEYQDQGNHSINFDGSYLASGTYFYQLIFDNNIQTKKLLLIK